MLNKSAKLAIVSLLSLSLTAIGTTVFANNSLNGVDVRKNSADGLEFTLYTTSPYADNVIVTKKSDNKYVILMPNVGSASARPDLSSVKDVVSNVDVRAINDGGNGYTKVTVITTKPVSIKTNTAKSAPETAEQREYRALIAQQKTKPAQPVQTTKPQTAKASTPSASVFKLPEIQPTVSPAEKVKEMQKAQPAVKPAAAPSPKPAEKQVAEKKQNVINAVNKKLQETVKKEEVKKVEKQQIKEKQAVDKEIKNIVPPAPPAKTAQTTQAEPAKPVAAPVQKDIKTPKPINRTNYITKIKNTIQQRMPDNMPLTIAIVLIPLICLITLFKVIKASVIKSNILKKSFADNLSKKPIETPSYDNIINNESLSWQEKYQQYRDESGENKKAKPKETKYNFIAPKVQKSAQAKPSVKSEAKIMNEEVSTPQKLEQIYNTSPSVEKTPLEQEIQLSDSELLAKEPQVQEEENTIQKQLTKTIKLKAFEQKMALEETSRNKKVKHRRVQLELPKEGKHVELGFSQLHTNPRAFKNGNLSVSDLIAKSDKLLGKKKESKPANDYEMITVDEYFNIIGDNDISKVTSPLSDKVADTLAQIRPASNFQPSHRAVTNPISHLRNETKEDYLNGLIVKSGYNIDNDRGFYLVSLDGISALIGRINEEVFVLKKFDRNIDKPLQVRMDNPNVYMVKAGNFKSLVEVSKNQMGVLIEL